MDFSQLDDEHLQSAIDDPSVPEEVKSQFRKEMAARKPQVVKAPTETMIPKAEEAGDGFVNWMKKKAKIAKDAISSPDSDVMGTILSGGTPIKTDPAAFGRGLYQGTLADFGDELGGLMEVAPRYGILSAIPAGRDENNVPRSLGDVTSSFLGQPIGQTLDMVRSGGSLPPAKDYTQARNALRSDIHRSEEEHPVSAFSGTILGAIESPLNKLLPGSAGPKATLGQKAGALAKRIAAGSGMGGLYGLGNSQAELMDGDVGGAAGDVGTGMAFGAAGQGIGEGFGALGAYLGKKVPQALVRALGGSDDATKKLAVQRANQLNEFATEGTDLVNKSYENQLAEIQKPINEMEAQIGTLSAQRDANLKSMSEALDKMKANEARITEREQAAFKEAEDKYYEAWNKFKEGPYTDKKVGVDNQYKEIMKRASQLLSPSKIIDEVTGPILAGLGGSLSTGNALPVTLGAGRAASKVSNLFAERRALEGKAADIANEFKDYTRRMQKQSDAERSVLDKRWSQLPDLVKELTAIENQPLQQSVAQSQAQQEFVEKALAELGEKAQAAKKASGPLAADAMVSASKGIQNLQDTMTKAAYPSLAPKIGDKIINKQLAEGMYTLPPVRGTFVGGDVPEKVAQELGEGLIDQGFTPLSYGTKNGAMYRLSKMLEGVAEKGGTSDIEGDLMLKNQANKSLFESKPATYLRDARTLVENSPKGAGISGFLKKPIDTTVDVLANSFNSDTYAKGLYSAQKLGELSESTPTTWNSLAQLLNGKREPVMTPVSPEENKKKQEEASGSYNLRDAGIR